MKQPVVDYRKFRFSKLNNPEFSHLKLLAGWLVYFLFYFLTENFIPYDACHVMHSRLDDLIPFNEFFFIPYCFWYVLIVISLGYFLLYDIENFKNLQKYIIITQVVAMAVYIVYPSIQDLRPTDFARDTFFTPLAAFVVFNVFLISAATMFVKQHSAIDVACALPLGLLAEILVFGKYWKAKFSRKSETV